VNSIRKSLSRSKITAVLGPRQCGKSTLARYFYDEHQSKATYFDLEHPADKRALQNPMSALESLQGLIIIDEIQIQPELFPILRVLADRPHQPATFLLLGSSSPDLIRQSSESLAGRIEFVYMNGLSLSEVSKENWKRLWLRGGFPLSYLADHTEDSYAWRENFIHTFLERDIRRFGIDLPPAKLLRFWAMLAHHHGHVWNASSIGNSLDVSNKTAQRYLDILHSTFMIRVLQPWHVNIKKRQVKAPKIFIRDSGILHTLLELENMLDVQRHPKLGFSWEGFALECILDKWRPRTAYFWGTHAHAELDLFLTRQGKQYGFEFKFGDAPKCTKSMRIAIQDLELDHLYVIYPGSRPFSLADDISVIPIDKLDLLPEKN